MRGKKSMTATIGATIAAGCAAALTPAAADAQTLGEGDVVINATVNPEGDCLRIEYEVSRALGSEYNGFAYDFHVEVNDTARHFRDFKVERFERGHWIDPNWTGSHEEQQENQQTKRYISWYPKRDKDGNIDGDAFRVNHIFRFSVLYCGNDNNLDNTIEYYLTTDGAKTPALPDEQGERENIPDVWRGDEWEKDEGWFGQESKAFGSSVGFITF